MEFSSPSVFYYLCLLIIPIIIHLFHFRKHEKIYFSSIHFLKNIYKKNKSKHKIKQWILLLNRLGIISLIILAFTLPFIKEKGHAQDVNKIGIYIDNSFSMNRLDENKNELIYSAKENAKHIINQLKPTQKVLILTNDFEKKHQKWYLPEEAILLIDSIKTSGHTNRINTIINRYHKNLDTIFFNSLYLLSDFQKTDNQTITPTHNNTIIKILNLQADHNDNISVDSCFFTNPIRKTSEIEQIQIKLTNHSSDNINTTANLIINEQKKSTHDITIPANSTITEKLHYVNPDDTNIINGTIEIENDNMAFDNKLYFSYSTQEKLSVLVLFEKEESHCFTKIFSDSLFNYKSYNINNIEYLDINKQSLIVFDKLTHIPKSLIDKIEQYIRDGNSLFIFPHKDLDIQSYNNFFKYINVDFIDQWVEKNNFITEINYKHPIYYSTFNKEDEKINLPIVSGYFQQNTNPNSKLRDILIFADKSMFLSEYLYYKGSVFFCSSDLSEEYTNFTKHALFIPCIYNAALLNFNTNKLYHNINQEIILKNNYITNNDIIHLKQGDIFDMMPTIETQKHKNVLNFKNKIKKAGNYELIINQTNHKPMSFNYTQKESNMQYLNKKELQLIFQENNVTFIPQKENKIVKNYHENNNKNNLEKFFIAASIILLIIEVILLRLWKI